MSLPSSFGSYRVERELGSGGMGVVLAATHVASGAEVAIKVLHAKYRRVGVIRERFLREARAASALESPHVVKVLEVGCDPSGIPYIVMERLHGRDLEQLVTTGGPVSEDTAIEYLLQACAGLAEAHALGIVHRDVKPENIFLAQERSGAHTIRVLDFGISKSALESRQLTAMGEIMGTPHFMAPEQLQSARDVTARVDVWALGVTLYWLLSGSLPFDADNAVELAIKIRQMAPTPLEHLRPRLSAEIAAIVRRCLAKDPLARFANATELRRALDDVRERSRANSRLGFAATVHALPVAKLASVSPKRHRRGYTFLVGAMFASLVAILALNQRSALASVQVEADERLAFTPVSPEPAATELLGARVGAETPDRVSKSPRTAAQKPKK